MKSTHFLVALFCGHGMAIGQTLNNSTVFIQGAYSSTVTASDNDGGGTWDLRSDSIPSVFADFFDETDNIRFDAVALTAPTTGQVFAVRNRAGDGPVVAQYSIRFFTPGSGYTNPVLETKAFRSRNTAWQGSPFIHSPLASIPAAGTYDIEIVNLAGGSHIEGLGFYTPPTLIGAGPAIVQESALAFANGGKEFKPIDHPSGVGTYNDNQFTGTSWLDYEVFNPGPAKACNFSVRARHNMGFDVLVNAKVLEADGDVPATFTSATVASTGWQTSEFFDYTSSTSFILPAGYSVIRINSDNPVHLDSITFIPASAPVPLSKTNVVIVPATSTLPATLTATVTGAPSATVVLEASIDLGQANAWTTIHTFSLNASGQATVTNIPHTGAANTSRDFFRVRYQ